MENLNTYTLEELSIGKGRYGIPAPAIPFNSSKYTYLRITDINDDGSLNKENLMSVDAKNIDNFVLRKNDIVFARTGNSTGRSYFYDGSDGKLVYAGFLVKFSIDEKKVNPRILKYYTHSKRYFDWIYSFDTGGTRGNINAKTYGKMPITLPPRWIQNKIVNILKSLDDKIELNNKINRNLEAQAQAILGANLNLQKSTPLHEFLSFVNGFAFKSQYYQNSGKYRIITIKNVQDGKIDSQGSSCIDIFPEKFSPNCILNIGDVLLSLTGNVGRVGIVCEENLLLNQRVAKVKVKQDTLLPLVYFILRNSNVKNRMESISKGTAQQNLSPIDALKLEVNITKENILYLSKILKSFYDSIIRNEKESQRLVQLRESLLPKLMSGEIDVTDIAV